MSANCLLLTALAVALIGRSDALRSRVSLSGGVSSGSLPPPVQDLNSLEYDECLLLSSKDGIDVEHCDCPAGFVLCTHEEVKHRMKNEKNLWPFVTELCTHQKYDDDTLVYVDFNHFLKCTGSELRPLIGFQEDALGAAANRPKGLPKCFSTPLFLCKRVNGSDARDCEISEWEEWSNCDKKTIRRRRRRVLRSGQHGGAECMWNYEPLDENRVIQVEECTDTARKHDEKKKK